MTYTLLADGTSDKILLPILTWSLQQQDVTPIVEQWADLSRIPTPRNAEERLITVLDLFPCDVLFVHRDAEAQPAGIRRRQITQAMSGINVRHIPVVPVRMTEAWLLFNELAIRTAAGNPNCTADLSLPDLRRLEDVADPKSLLHSTLATASGLNARRRRRLPVHQQVHRIPAYIDDYSCLNVLPAFQTLQDDIRSLVATLQPPPAPGA